MHTVLLQHTPLHCYEELNKKKESFYELEISRELTNCSSKELRQCLSFISVIRMAGFYTRCSFSRQNPRSEYYHCGRSRWNWLAHCSLGFLLVSPTAEHHIWPSLALMTSMSLHCLFHLLIIWAAHYSGNNYYNNWWQKVLVRLQLELDCLSAENMRSVFAVMQQSCDPSRMESCLDFLHAATAVNKHSIPDFFSPFWCESVWQFSGEF